MYQETDFLILEGGIDRLSQNIGTGLPIPEERTS
jgi:hypothetical protein